MTKLVYCATPSRLSDMKEDILHYVDKNGFAPLHPFSALPYELFEGGNVGREKTLEYCLRLVDACDEFWMFGVSDGTLEEFFYSYTIGKPINFLMDKFDPNWKGYYKQLKGKKPNDLIRAFELSLKHS